MILFFLLLILLLLFLYTKRSKIYYILLLIFSISSYLLMKINPDLNEKYNFRQIIYLIDNFNFFTFIVLSFIILTFLLLIIYDTTNKKSSRILFSFISLLGTLLIFLIALSINIFLIREPLKNNFEGYVFNEIKKPLVGVKVINGNSSNNYVLTDKKGFFKLKRKEEIDNNSNLVFMKKGYKDSLVLIKVDRYHPPSSYFIFLREEMDTLRMKKSE